MNVKKLKQLEVNFLERYPGGFKNEEIEVIAKKHKMDKMVQFAQESFSNEAFMRPGDVLEDIGKIVSRASMVSMFEKPKFRDFIKGIGSDEQDALLYGLKERLHGNEQEGFELITDILRSEKLAKWSLVSIIPIYFRPTTEVFVKPTTAKNIIKYLELTSLTYKPAPTWEFYDEFRKQILKMKEIVSPDLSVNNAAFTGFLMMSMPQE